MDSLAKAITSFALISTVLVSGFVYFYSELPFLSTLLLLIIASPYFFSPKDFLLTDDYLVIKKVLREIKIPIKEIEEIRLLEKVNGTRVFGSGGLYGYFGYFHFKNIGSVKMYAKRRSKLILVICVNKKFIISPENPEEFVAKLEKKIWKIRMS